MVFGRPHRHFRSTDSTNDRARELAEAGTPSGTVVTAGEQSAGRGRHGRVWSAAPGSALLYSAVLHPLDERHGLLPLAVPLAVCDALESVAQVSCRVKWPNDVWVDEAKVAGVLIEARPPDWAVIGVGVNVSIAPEDFPGDLRWPATSLEPGGTGGIDVGGVCEALNVALGERVEEPLEETLAAFRERDALLGREIGWVGAGSGVGEGSGTARGVDERGNLVVETAVGEQLALGSGEVSLRLGGGTG
jgi:BirA family transcriptional regulator, biotin operon repressor / biotin---[acetyl-CoA-carboxylase] ligase